MAVKKCTQGKAGSWGRMDTMLPVVRKPSESTQIPLALSRRMSMMVSTVMRPSNTRGEEIEDQWASNHWVGDWFMLPIDQQQVRSPYLWPMR